MVGVTPASAAPSSTDLQTTVQSVQSAATGAAAPATGSDRSDHSDSCAESAAVGPAPRCSLDLPSISVLVNELGSTPLPNQDSTTGTNSTGQSSPVGQRQRPDQACSLSVGVAADAGSSCSTTSVGLNEPGGLADANAPITAQDNAIGLLNEAATALGLAGGQSSASTSQNGAVNADAPVSICSVNVGLAADTSSGCSTTGTSGPSTQTGVVDAEVPVGVCDVIAEIDGDSSSNCPQQADPVTQQGQAANVFVPVTACGAIVEVDGSANGMCLPDAGFPLANDLPTSDASQSAPADAVVPVNACSVAVAVDGTASNSCEPSHLGTTTTGTAPVSAPVTLCAVTAALDGNSSATCEGAGSTFAPIGTAGSPATGATAPVTICGIQGALSGSADASCSQPTTAASTVTPSAAAGTPAPSSSAATPIPASLVSNPSPLTRPTVATAASSASSLASTGAPLLLEVLIGLGSLAVGLAIRRSARRRSGRRLLAD